MTWADIKAQARQTVHETFSVDAWYTPRGLPEMPDPVAVRLHSGDKKIGDLSREGYAEVIEHLESVVFDKLQVTTSYKGSVRFADGRQFILDFKHPDDGSQFVKWDVIAKEDE